ncbi:LETM1 and EF-hand domain-containing protein 1, mitochondrial [Armadillidium vulgare]|nr:LETM1 and EF-hand domain-containing protein 1, mitochondrial [Armadillidium vulgare]
MSQALHKFSRLYKSPLWPIKNFSVCTYSKYYYYISNGYIRCCSQYPRRYYTNKPAEPLSSVAFSPAFHVSYTTVILPKRSFHSSFICLENEKPSSQVEVTVHDLKEKTKAISSSAQQPPKSDIVVKKSIGTRIKEEILHYYHGFKLLFIDIGICSKYVWRILNGENLSRREVRQLIRTTSDLFRLLPFSVFIIIPFMEILLPVALKLFPGMLPSTFETTNEKEAKMKKTLKVKLEMAKFLQQTLDNMAVEGKGHKSENAKDFVEFFDKIQKTGQDVSNVEILKFSKLFEDEITLDSLSRPQLVALCRLLEMQPFGTNNFLRFQLRMKLRNLAADDRIIKREGIESMAVWELQQACRARGMRAYGLSKDRLQVQLQQWLDLSLNEKVPPSLLLLSRTLFLPEKLQPEETLAATISTLPEEVATRTKASIGKREGKIDNLTRLEVIKAEEKKIKEDKLEMEKELEEKRKKEEKLKKKSEEAMQREGEDAAEFVGFERLDTVSEFHGVRKVDDEVLIDTAPVLKDKAVDLEKPVVVDTKKDELTAEDIDHVEEALEMIELEKKRAFIEEKELSELKSELADYEEDIHDFKKALKDAGMEKSLRESKAARRLFSRVNKMINKLDPVVSALNDQKESLKKKLEEGQKDALAETELINLQDLAEHLKHILSTPDSAKVEKIRSVLAKMDDDMDGAVKAQHVIDVLELLSENPEGLPTKLFEEVVEMMVKEEQLEAQTLAEKALQLPSFSQNIRMEVPYNR